MASFVPDGFPVPAGLVGDGFVLEPLGPQHNEADYRAWAGSIDHIRATPGFAGWSWPDPDLSLEDNLGDLSGHADDFVRREGFTYSVLDPSDGDVIGCVYIYPGPPGLDAAVRSWVRADRADLDVPLWEAVSAWLEEDWPFGRVGYAPRPPG